ncbi:hypothetical protein ACM25N_05640 [Roseovarius sp. C7]|uniref:hypothetical protein n=1 Tax=Roseovarius sp. C7 TaxID=3398643 RepID=UPI0039F6D08D
MRYLALVFIASLSVTPAHAQEDNDGLSMIEEGARLFLEGLAEEMGPAMKDLADMAESWQPAMRDFMAEMGPALSDILGKVDDVSRYHLPEMLPNGDIIIRRKPPVDGDPEGAETPEVAPGEEIEI